MTKIVFVSILKINLNIVSRSRFSPKKINWDARHKEGCYTVKPSQKKNKFAFQQIYRKTIYLPFFPRLVALSLICREPRRAPHRPKFLQNFSNHETRSSMYSFGHLGSMLKLSQDKNGTVDLLSGFKQQTNVTYTLPCHQNTQKGPASTVLLRMSWLGCDVVLGSVSRWRL